MRSTSTSSHWIEKARQDARSARRLLQYPPELEDAAYHVHQAVEKSAKALLTAEGIKFPRGGGAGHDLDRLAKLIPSSHPLHDQAERLTDLTPWATAFRYPADDPLTAEPPPSKQDIEQRLETAEAFVEAVARQMASPVPIPRR